jgi:hypothetical protein
LQTDALARGCGASCATLDGVHPTHAVRFACGWIKKGLFAAAVG